MLLRFNAAERCQPFVVNPEIARRAQKKQCTNERAYAQLLEDTVRLPLSTGAIQYRVTRNFFTCDRKLHRDSH
jgi:hypothetical protein